MPGAVSLSVGQLPGLDVVASGLFFGVSGALIKGRNIASVTRVGTGQWQIVFSAALASNQYIVAPTWNGSVTTASPFKTTVTSLSTTGFTLSFFEGATAQDAEKIAFAVYL